MMVACKGTEDHIRSTASLDVHASGYIVLFGGLGYDTFQPWLCSASLCKNENVICTQAELQAVAKFSFM